MGIDMIKHWEVGYLVRVEFYNHVHLVKVEYPWVSQTPKYAYPTPIVGH